MEDREERAQDSEYGWIFDKPQEKAGMQDGMEAETQSVPEKKKTAARKRTRKTGSDGQENSRGQEKEAGAGGSAEDPRSIEQLSGGFLPVLRGGNEACEGLRRKN